MTSISTENTSTVTVGMVWGDEGKAKVLTDNIAESLEAGRDVINPRFQGGANAGHTVYVRTESGIVEFISHMAPIGVASNCKIAEGPDVAFNPIQFWKEVSDAKKLFGFNNDIYLSERTGVLFDYHKKIDKLHEAEAGRVLGKKVGTTQSGIGPFYMDNARRTTRITLVDYVSPEFNSLLGKVMELKRQEIEAALALDNEDLRKAGVRSVSDYHDWIVAQHEGVRRELRPFVCRLEYILRRAIESGKTDVHVEGGQGSMLDVNMGTTPDQTASHLLATDALASLGLPRRAVKIIGVAKVCPTRVGGGYMPTLADDEFGAEMQKNSGEFGKTTGRARRVGYPDWVILRYAAMINDIDEIALTRIDNAQDRDIKVCIGYDTNGLGVSREVPMKLQGIIPFYDMKSYRWHLFDAPADLSDPIKVDVELKSRRKAVIDAGFDNLPADLIEYVRNQDKYVGKPVTMLSIGPTQGEMLRRH